MKKIFLMAILFCLVGCFGPKPVVRDQFFQPSPNEKGAYEVHVLVENISQGEGDAKIKVRLMDTKTKITYRQEKSMQLKSHEKSMAILLVRAPEGLYELQTEAQYPAE